MAVSSVCSGSLVEGSFSGSGFYFVSIVVEYIVVIWGDLASMKFLLSYLFRILKY